MSIVIFNKLTGDHCFFIKQKAVKIINVFYVNLLLGKLMKVVKLSILKYLQNSFKLLKKLIYTISYRLWIIDWEWFEKTTNPDYL